MKRTFLYIISVVLLFSFTACGVAIPNDGATIEKTATGTQTSVESITSEQDTSDKMDETEPVAEDQTKEVEAIICKNKNIALRKMICGGRIRLYSFKLNVVFASVFLNCATGM